MRSNAQSHQAQARSWGQTVFAETVRLALAPIILLFSGFFTANFIISGQYTWPRTSRVVALTVTVLILSYEFVYKEQLAQEATSNRARMALVYSCLIPYLAGVLVMLALWKL